MKCDLIVIGGGASGLMTAGVAASRGLDVLLLEKNEKLGKKIFISGKGRCNITNSLPINEFIENIPGNRNFLYSALYTFTNTDLIDFLDNYGLETKIERGGRVFPKSDKSSDVIKTFEQFLSLNKVKVKLNSQVVSIIKNDSFEVTLINGDKLYSENVVISTGGVTYPSTGSTGDGYSFAKKFGHTVVNPKPSLVPLVVQNADIKELQGLSLKNVSIRLLINNKKVYDDFGEMLFTHYGLTGPIILSASRHLTDVDFEKKTVDVIIDLKPALSEEQLDLRIQRDFDDYKNKQFKNSLDKLLPQKLIPYIINLSGIDRAKYVNQITKAQRQKLISILKNLSFKIIGTRPISEGIVTCGGINTKEIDPSTMKSKLVQGLYFTGEVIDIDGYTGGYNLQIAFSTGYLAGISVNKN